MTGLDTDLATLRRRLEVASWPKLDRDVYTALDRVEAALRDKDAEIARLMESRRSLLDRNDRLQSKIARLTQEQEDHDIVERHNRERAEAAERELARLENLVYELQADKRIAEEQHAEDEAELARLRKGLRRIEKGVWSNPREAVAIEARALLAEDGAATCKCPSGSYNPGAVHEPYCPLAEDGAAHPSFDNSPDGDWGAA